ncbi:MAG: hypothetical protein WA375_12995, partial [Pseudolabrys sp.]
HDVAYALILQFFEFGVADFFPGVLAKRLAQGLRAQQAPDVIGTKRRTALSGRHASWLPIFYSSIDGI